MDSIFPSTEEHTFYQHMRGNSDKYQNISDYKYLGETTGLSEASGGGGCGLR